MFNPHIGEELDAYIEKNKRLIYSCCQPYISRGKNVGYEVEDLFNIGAIGFMKAYERFDPIKFEKVSKFSTYAVPMIRGEIQRELRDTNGNAGLKFSRGIKELYYKINKENLFLESVSAIAEKFEASEEEVQDALHYGRTHVPKSIHETVYENDGDPITLMDTVCMNEDYTNVNVQAFLDTLTEKERQIVHMRVDLDVQQSIVGEAIGVSQVQVSRLLQKIKSKLIKCMNGDVTVMSKTNVAGGALSHRQKRGKGDMAEAKRLIAETDMTPKQISDATGCNITTIRTYAYTMRKKMDQPAGTTNPTQMVLFKQDAEGEQDKQAGESEQKVLVQNEVIQVKVGEDGSVNVNVNEIGGSDKQDTTEQQVLEVAEEPVEPAVEPVQEVTIPEVQAVNQAPIDSKITLSFDIKSANAEQLVAEFERFILIAKQADKDAKFNLQCQML